MKYLTRRNKLKKTVVAIIAISIAVIAFILPITIPFNEDTTLIIGGEDFSLMYFLKSFFIHIVLVVVHYMLILAFFKFIIKNTIYKAFLDNKNILKLSMYIVLFNSFIRNSFSFEQFFSLDLNYTLKLEDYIVKL